MHLRASLAKAYRSNINFVCCAALVGATYRRQSSQREWSYSAPLGSVLCDLLCFGWEVRRSTPRLEMVRRSIVPTFCGCFIAGCCTRGGDGSGHAAASEVEAEAAALMSEEVDMSAAAGLPLGCVLPTRTTSQQRMVRHVRNIMVTSF